MSLENGILGYLSMEPLSGYDIKKLFDISASNFWPADQAQIYRSLRKLEDDGLVELKEHTHGDTVSKKVYAVTDTGREALREWLLNPTQADFIIRAPYVMQLFFSGALSREEQSIFINKHIELIRGLLQAFQENFYTHDSAFLEIAQVQDDHPVYQSAVCAFRWGVLRYEAYLKLLEETKERMSL